MKGCADHVTPFEPVSASERIFQVLPSSGVFLAMLLPRIVTMSASALRDLGNEDVVPAPSLRLLPRGNCHGCRVLRILEMSLGEPDIHRAQV